MTEGTGPTMDLLDNIVVRCTMSIATVGGSKGKVVVGMAAVACILIQMTQQAVCLIGFIIGVIGFGDNLLDARVTICRIDGAGLRCIGPGRIMAGGTGPRTVGCGIMCCIHISKIVKRTHVTVGAWCRIAEVTASLGYGGA